MIRSKSRDVKPISLFYEIFMKCIFEELISFISHRDDVKPLPDPYDDLDDQVSLVNVFF